MSVSTSLYRRQPLPSAIRVWSQTPPPRQTVLPGNFLFFLFLSSSLFAVLVVHEILLFTVEQLTRRVLPVTW